MSVNTPPNPNVSTFNNLYWIRNNDVLTVEDANKLYLKFPVAQGTENLQAINVNGIANFNSNVDVAGNVEIGGFGSLKLTSANAILTGNATIQQTGSITSNNFGVSKFNADTTFTGTSDIIQESGSQILQQPATTGIVSNANILNSSIVRTNFGSSPNTSLQILDTSSQGIYFLPNAINNAYDNIVQTGDAVIVTTGAPLVLANGISSSTNGIRLDTTQLSLGYGGTGDVPSTLITCNASTINVTPSLTFPDTRVQNSAFTGAGALSGSYTNTNMTVDSNGKITALSNGTSGSVPFAPKFANFANYQTGTSGYSQGTVISWSGTWGALDYAIFRITAQANWGNTGSGWQNYASTSGQLILRPHFAPTGVWSSNSTNPARYTTNSNNVNIGAVGKAIYYTGAINNGTQTDFFMFGTTTQIELQFSAPGATGGWLYTNLVEYICHSTSGGSITFGNGSGTNNSLP